MQQLLIFVIKFYQRTISPNVRCSCRFWPTCSEYTILAIQKYGVAKGLIKSIWRILRCNPLNVRNGIDFP